MAPFIILRSADEPHFDSIAAVWRTASWRGKAGIQALKGHQVFWAL